MAMWGEIVKFTINISEIISKYHCQKDRTNGQDKTYEQITGRGMAFVTAVGDSGKDL